MNYTVIWKSEAERLLAQLWNQASNRQQIADAANQIDAKLKRNPQGQGESRANGRRVLFEPPLGIIYRVLPDDRQVWVLKVWQFKLRAH